MCIREIVKGGLHDAVCLIFTELVRPQLYFFGISKDHGKIHSHGDQSIQTMEHSRHQVPQLIVTQVTKRERRRKDEITVELQPVMSSHFLQ